jgi:cytosine deaminase
MMAHMAHLTAPDQLETVYDMISINAARAMGVDDLGVAPGNRADLLVLDTDSVWNAFRLRPDCVCVIKGGNVIAETKTQRRVLRTSGMESLAFEKPSTKS